MRGGGSGSSSSGIHWSWRRVIRQVTIAAVGSARIKLMLCCGIALMLLALASRASDFVGWTIHSQPLHPFPGPGYTIVITTWKRYDLLKEPITHYSSCSGLDSIHTVWSEPNPPSESLVKFLNHVVESKPGGARRVHLVFDINKEDSLNNRCKEIKDLKTHAVFSIDDDVIFACPSVEFAFNVWQSAPDTMVGYVPRARWIDENCEDIATSFLVANATRAPPIWVKGKIFEIGSTGISSMGGHDEKITDCVYRFAAEFVHMPTVKALDSRGVWFW